MTEELTITIKAKVIDGKVEQLTVADWPITSHPKLCQAIMRTVLRVSLRGAEEVGALVLPSHNQVQNLFEIATPGEVGHCLDNAHGIILNAVVSKSYTSFDAISPKQLTAGE